MGNVVLETERLYIRPLSELEMKALADENKEKDPEMCEAYSEMLELSKSNPDSYLWYTAWGLFSKDGNDLIGDACFKGPPQKDKAPEIGYGITPRLWGKGLAFEGVFALCDWAFKESGVNEIEAETAPDNIASKRVLLKLGFALNGKIGEEGPRYLLKRESFYNEAGAARFRTMRRKKQELSFSSCEEILTSAPSGVLVLSGDGGYPYAVPLSFLYENGKIYFHCAKSGHKIDAVKNCDKASFCVIAQDDVLPEKYTTLFKSVTAFGKIHIVTDDAEINEAITALAKKYAPLESEESRKKAIADEYAGLCILRLDILNLSGKQGSEFLKMQNQ